MRKVFLQSSILVFVSVLLFSSCKKDDSNILSDQNVELQNKISAIHGRLVFRDQSAFENCLKWIFDHQNSSELIEQYFKKLEYTSMMEVYKMGMSLDKDSEEFSLFCKNHTSVFLENREDGSLTYELQVPSILAYIANENGVYQVGKKIIRVSSLGTIAILNGDESKLPMLFEPLGSISDANIEILPTSSTKGEYSYRTSYFEDKHRLVARLRSEAIGYMYYYFARSTAQKKNWLGIWVQEDISSLTVSWPGGGFYTEGGQAGRIASANFSVTNNSDLEKVVVFSDSPIVFNQSSCIALHTGVRLNDDGIYVYREVANNEVFPD